MHEFVSINGEILKAVDARIGAVSSAALYGNGIFTTIAIHDSQPFLWEKHWRRLTGDAVKLGIDTSAFFDDALRESLDEILKRNRVTSGRARLTFFDESSTGIWKFETGRKTSVLIITGEPREIPENLRLSTSPFKIHSESPLAGVKSCNYTEKILALGEAKERGFDEAVQLNERGFIASACMANIFWIESGKLFTPALRTGCLAGTTREFVLENAECAEVEADLEAFRNAESVFLTSAGLPIVRVAEIDGKILGPLPDSIRELWPPD